MQTKIFAYVLGAFLLAGLSATAAYGQSAPEQVIHATYVVDIPAGANAQNADVFYNPGNIAIPTGTTVAWFNDDPNQIHTVTSGSPGDEDAGSAFGSDYMQEGSFFQHTFNSAGEFPYFCSVHPWMVGKVSVSDSVWEGHHFNLGMGTGATFDFTKNERTLFSFQPTSLNVDEDAPVDYRLTILKDDQEVFSGDFLTLGGNLQVELVPSDGATRVYGPDVSDPVIGAYHIEGSFLKATGNYKVKAEITTVAGKAPENEVADEFGVQIVPEFPIGLILPIAAGIGASVFAGKRLRK